MKKNSHKKLNEIKIYCKILNAVDMPPEYQTKPGLPNETPGVLRN